MSEFVSKLEEMMPAIELNFEPTPAFGKYKRFLEHAVAHPAKMNTNLLEFLILNFTKEGDVILDPMAGSGSTGVVAALHGRNAIQVDIEKKFYNWMEQAREKVEQFPTLIRKGWIRNICGDARRLSELLNQADVVITSPPYLKSADTGAGVNKQREGDVKIGCATVGRTVEHPEAIDNTRDYGNIDAIITSPPYVDLSKPGNIKRPITKEEYEERKRKGDHSVYHDVRPERKGTLYEYYEIISIEKYGGKENIDQLPLGSVDAIITSPPYADAKKGGEADVDKMAERWDRIASERDWNTWGKTWKTDGRKRGLKVLGSGYSDSEDNIGNLPFVDAVITSPPYEQGLGHNPGKNKITKLGIVRPEYNWHNPNQIGTMQKETYLEAMLRVYTEMFKVLKPNGLAIVVVKPFIRNKKVVDLPYHTFLLMSRAGFKLEKLYKLRLRNQSFWRILYYKKHPEAPRIAHEYVLVARKAI